jgi:hypothetical protein
MPTFTRTWSIYMLAVVLFYPALTNAQCNPGPNDGNLLILDATSGSPVATTSFNYTLKNDTDVLVRLTNINPYAFKCSVSTTSTPFKETAVASFLGQLGGIANISGASTPDAGKAPAGVKSAGGLVGDCVQGYKDGAHKQAEDLQAVRDLINAAFLATQNNMAQKINSFNDNVGSLRTATGCQAIKTQASTVTGITPAVVATVSLPGGGTPVPLDQAVDILAFRAQRLLSHLTEGTKDCSLNIAALIDQDTAFLEALVHGSSSVQSAVDKWRDQLKIVNSVNTNIRKIQDSIAGVLSNPQNFTIDTQINGHQEAITVTASCTPVPPQTISSDPSSPAMPPAGGTPPAGNSWKHDFRFGIGPRFVYAGGVVISPLPQQIFSTSTNPAGSTPPNIITKTQDSGTRVLPIAMLHARYFDLISASDTVQFIPNYLSAGITAKPSDNNGTSVEYLFGLSWAFAERQLFLTAGAYAGRQQRLGDSLVPNQTTTLGSANLPITQSLIWKAGFALTWAPGGK